MKHEESSSLAGRVAVVTGASSGIGEATARALAARGARVALLARRAERLTALAAELGAGALALPVDVTDRAAVAAAAERVRAALGPVDILFNNAGVMLPNPIEARREDQWQRQIDLNIGGLMHVIGAFTPDLVAAGATARGADLVNVSSIAARNIFPAFAVYSATKAFVTHLSVTLRAELGPKGVRVTSLEPGIVGTELQDHVDFEGARAWLAGARTQMEWLEPGDVAEAVAFTVGLPKRVNLQHVTIMPTGQPS